MSKIRDAGKIKARDRIAVLAALNLAFDQSEATPSATASTANETSVDSKDRLSKLLARLDQAIEADGQLI